MKATVFLLVAAFGLTCIMTSLGQVYSKNIVGYVEVPVTKGVYKMIANPLNTTNNTIGGVLTAAAGVHDGDQYLHWNGAGYTVATYASFLGGWDIPDIPFAPGGGGFYLPTTTTNLAFLGEVMTGDLSNSFPREAISIISSQVPQSGNVDSLGLTAGLQVGDQVIRFDGTRFYTATISDWTDWWDTGTPPKVNVGESFFINVSHAGTWTRTFNP